MSDCRFELKIKDSKYFQCAAAFGFNGWAYLWRHDEPMQNPCNDCEIKINGNPLVVAGEIRACDWGEIAGGRIRACDWEKIKRAKNEPNRKRVSNPAG